MKPSNSYLEQKNITPTRRAVHKKWKNIAQEFSDFNLTKDDLFNMNFDDPLVMQIAEKNNITIGDAIVLRQMAKAAQGDTRSAEFIRDTMGENPKQVVEVQKSKLETMTDKELEEALKALDARD